MSAGYYEAPVHLRLESPFLSAGLEAGRFGEDAAQLLDAHGRAVLPAGQVRGVLRHALLGLDAAGVEVSAALPLFGDEGDDLEHAGRIRVRDCTARQDTVPEARATRIRIDEGSGTVSEGALMVIALSHPIGAEVDFAGTIGFPAPDAGAARAIGAQLDLALRQVVAIGALKSIGFGRVVEAAVAAPSLGISFASGAVEPGAHAYDLSFTLDGPLLVDTSYPEHNVLRGADRISGAVLKGALARRLADAGLADASGRLRAPLEDILARAVFSFADVDSRPPPLALSLLQRYADGRTADLADATALAADDPALAASGRVAAFAGDWKGAHWREGERPSRSDLDFETRTRLAIAPETGAALPSALFSHQFVRPDPGRRWKGRILWPDDDAPPPQFYELLGHLRAGLFSIGRLKAGTADVRLTPAVPPPAASGPAERVALVLDTPHLMLRAANLADEATLVAAVDAFFADASGGAWALARNGDGDPLMFARQELRGGFQAARYAPFGANRLEPFVLMSAGSVFMLDPAAPVAKAELDRWKRIGLPDPAWPGVELTYESCPFLRANGYGAIRIARPGNLAAMTERAT